MLWYARSCLSHYWFGVAAVMPTCGSTAMRHCASGDAWYGDIVRNRIMDGTEVITVFRKSGIFFRMSICSQIDLFLQILLLNSKNLCHLGLLCRVLCLESQSWSMLRACALTVRVLVSTASLLCAFSSNRDFDGFYRIDFLMFQSIDRERGLIISWEGGPEGKA